MSREWSFGLRNDAGKFLTAETFGHRINASSAVMKKKQIFFLETHGDKVALRTHANRYISVNKDGRTVTGESESVGDTEKFEVLAQADGRWAFRSHFGSFFGGSGDDINHFTPGMDESSLTDERLWHVVLAMHPQVNLRNVRRKMYVHLSGDQLTTDEVVPWGADALITLVFFDSGKYGFEVSDGRYLSANGTLKNESDSTTQFTLIFFGGEVAFRSDAGGESLYLTSVGGKGMVKASKPAEAGVSPDELFVIEDSHPQIKLTNVSNGKKASVYSGSEVSCNQTKSEDTETFQIEQDERTKKWSLKTCKATYLTLDGAGAIRSDVKDHQGADSLFEVKWLKNKLALKANNGKFVAIKKNGSWAANGDAVTDESSYVFEIINRPQLVLRGQHGFLGTMPSGAIQCNKSLPEVYNMHVTQGDCHISGSNGKYWKVSPDGITVDGSTPDAFHLEFIEPSKLAIRYGDKYLQGSQNGKFGATGTSIDESTLFEF